MGVRVFPFERPSSIVTSEVEATVEHLRMVRVLIAQAEAAHLFTDEVQRVLAHGPRHWAWQMDLACVVEELGQEAL